MGLRFSRRLPDRPGWYWYKGSRDRGRDRAVKVVEVVDYGGVLRFGDGRLPAGLADWRGEWAGPIPEPGQDQRHVWVVEYEAGDLGWLPTATYSCDAAAFGTRSAARSYVRAAKARDKAHLRARRRVRRYTPAP